MTIKIRNTFPNLRFCSTLDVNMRKVPEINGKLENCCFEKEVPLDEILRER